MKVVIIGATGKIGEEVARALEPRHEIIRVGSRRGDFQADYADKKSVQELFEAVSNFDALVSVVGGDSVFKPYADLTDADFEFGFRRKFLAQLNLIRIGVEYVKDGGSFTLSTGFLSHYPNPSSIATGPFNAAVDSLVLGIAPLLPRAIRVNVVSPAPIVAPDRVGQGTISAEQASQFYVESVEGDFTGQVLRAWGGLSLPS
jgi:NAD(P)-dependent dehydrogenase (short-subunit alcohol dehydrogenase family)